ncbi:MAG TPA: glycine--tRNA ligase [Patescibacteria group bacterium]|nr:glycine--tRNA ligase [Patescibacteria group bacterium]
MQKEELTKMDKLISLAKRRGFVFQSSEIYGGFGSCYDYGPLGVELINNIKKAWWKAMVQKRDDVVGLDSAIIMHPRVWEASGHVESFADPLVDCKKCKKRFRADHLLEAASMKPDLDAHKEPPKSIKDIVCPECGGELTEPRNFNLLMKTHIGAVEDESSLAYLRGETCQGIYVNFKNILDSSRQKLPFGIAQIGKAFRNEITPGNYIFRTREFEQMEMQFFVNPKEADKWYQYWREERMKWYKDLGMRGEFIRWRQHTKEELAHYAKEAWDIEFDSPFGGWKELAGVHNRGNWDLSRHGEYSGVDLSYLDPETKEKYIPYIVETSDGAGRAMLAFLLNGYEEVETRSGDADSKHEKEVVLHLHKSLAPIKVAVLPLSKKEELQKVAHEIKNSLAENWMTQYDETGSIGKRYRRQDEIGTPYCVTVDFETANDKKVTVRDILTMGQERIGVEELKEYFREKLDK